MKAMPGDLVRSTDGYMVHERDAWTWGHSLGPVAMLVMSDETGTLLFFPRCMKACWLATPLEKLQVIQSSMKI